MVSIYVNRGRLSLSRASSLAYPSLHVHKHPYAPVDRRRLVLRGAGELAPFLEAMRLLIFPPSFFLNLFFYILESNQRKFKE